MDLISRQDTLDDVDAILRANLADNVAHPDPNIPKQHFVAILCRPNQMMPMIVNTVFAG